MKVKTVFFIISSTIFFVIPVQGDVITREDIILKGYRWEIIDVWSPQKDTAHFPNYKNPNGPDSAYVSFFKIGQTYKYEAYVYGGSDSKTTFLSRIENGECAGGYDTEDVYIAENKPGGLLPQYKLAGIDCSGFVSACWRVPRTNTVGLANISLNLGDKTKLKPGDILNIPGEHVILVLTSPENNRITTIESKPPGIILKRFRPFSEVASYTPYSIFPQFSEESPANGAVVEGDTLDISVIIAASGGIESNGVIMIVNGEPVDGLVLEQQGDKEWRVKAPYRWTG